MVKKHLVSTGLIVALIASNIIIGNQYINDSKQYNQKISKQKKIIQTTKRINAEEIRSKAYEIKVLHDQLNKVTQEKVKFQKELSRGGHSPPRMQFIVTAYTSDCEGCSGFTYTEHDVRNTIEYNGLRIIAADTTILPLYSIVRIDTEEKSVNAIVLDKGGAIKNHKLDLLVSSYDEAITFGKQNAKVTILRKGKG